MTTTGQAAEQSRQSTPGGEAPRTAGLLVVVGVDGSPGSRAALKFAAEEARLRGGRLRIIAAWQYPRTYGGSWTVPPELTPESDARDAVDEAIMALGENTAVNITYRVVEGHPAAMLLDAATEADLLVVGSRGLGGFQGLLLGSISTQCVHHARCPVVVVPPPHPDGEQPDPA